MSNDISESKCYQGVCGHWNDHKAPSPYTTPQALFLLGLRLLSSEQRNQFWQYLVLTDYGTRYIPPEKQAQLLKLLAQLAEEEKLYELDFFSRLRRFKEIRARTLREGGSHLALFQ